MTRTLLLLLVPAAAVLAAMTVAGLSLPVAAVVGVALGGAAAMVLWTVERARVDRLAQAVNDWLGLDRHRPVPTPHTGPWVHLAIALNALGAAYDQRGDRLARARTLREELVDAMREPALLFAADGRLVRANARARRRFSLRADTAYTPAQALGSAQLAGSVDEARALGRPVEVEMRIGDRDLASLAAPIGDEVILLVTDRTDRRLVDAVRRDFVANASHELKTPASGIQALAEALTTTIPRDPARAVELAAHLEQEAERLSHLVHDLIDLRRLEEAVAEDSRTAVDLAAIVRDEVGRRAREAEEGALSVEVTVPDRAMTAAVEEDVRLVVANLVDNAIAYNRREGRVEVEVRRADGSWELRVSDTGIGIARQDLDRIFERFFRVDVARSREAGGTGLGLSIVRHAAERHGGTVRVESILGQGTTFRVTLPIAPPD
ncbi:MAG: sensor histidine kinase [Nitriliruptorales bacterium]